MKRRTFFYLSSTFAVSSINALTYLVKTEPNSKVRIKREYLDHIQWAKELLSSNARDVKVQSKAVADYMNPITDPTYVTSEEGFSIHFANRFDTKIEIRVKNGERLLFFR